MALTLTSLSDLSAAGFDAIIDVRAPAEFAEDHLPGAINLPVLDDEERARVGTIYKQQSPFLARKVGAALVARNAARHLEEPLADMPGSWRPLVYCWRGGQRSGSFATILSQVGWRVEIVQGGYKSWRSLVVRDLNDRPFPARMTILDGNTGTAKTALLHHLAARGVQTIDLEGLAHHRGSLFGQRAGGQPSQKAFEGKLALAIDALDPAKPVVIEAESSRVGRVTLPKRIWQAMAAAPRVRVTAPLAARAAYLTRAYSDIVEDPAELIARIETMRPMQPAERIEEWLALAKNDAFEALAAGLMREHYDARYEKHRARFGREDDVVLQTDSLDDAALNRLADQIARQVG